MEGTNGHAANPQPQHHIAQLADSRIGQNPLNIGHYQSHGGGKDSGKGTNNSHCGQRLNRVGKERIATGNQKGTSSYHSGSMYQGANWSRTLHSIRQPYMEWELG
ncbi:hypothetical protein ES703_125241 [subsurface metagenome]